MFHKIDRDGSQTISRAELHALIAGITFETVGFDRRDAVKHLMHEFETTSNGMVVEEEFVQGMKRWINIAKGCNPGAYGSKWIDEYHEVYKL